ncbi:hypothetical protein ASG89_01210 [Paenibacillus sp. Soil766]|uniref:hypothetical protein n=1 Tax=Paenibacillus sp. Soil766 TaxID=1736404 RepID=UPI000709731B|nr:hypothetical protein [Paenibacillus sp. Soil766]KRF10186.1 hypothetical protein ASG89_01210 [Paenibacillus sp. Soil766]
MKHFALSCLIFTSIVLSQLHSATAIAAQQDLKEKKLPGALILTETQTVLYDSPNGTKIGTSSFSIVSVLDAEPEWHDRIINESEPLIWYKIATEQGESWIRPSHPEFPEDFFEWVQTSEEEVLYDEPLEYGKTTYTISQQPVKSMGTYQGYYRIQTWLGYKWIKPKHKLVPYYIPTNEYISLNATTPIFDAPEADANVIGYLSASQSVNTFERINRDWFHIHTWLGEQWINPSYYLPRDVQTRNETIELKGNTPIYSFPNREAKVLGTLAPQIVSVFESGSGWHHIHSSWLGDVWIYISDPAADPEMYKPPTVVVNQSIAGTWNSVQYDPASTGTRGFPLAPSIGIDWARDTSFSSGIVSFGKPVPFRFALANASDEPITIGQEENIIIEVSRITGSIYDPKIETVWRGTLPTLSYDFKTKMLSAEIDFDWDGKDSDGKPVPFGEYMARIKLPWTILYSIDGKNEALSQKVETSVLTKRSFIIGAP